MSFTGVVYPKAAIKMEQTTYTHNNWDESQGLSERSQFLKMTHCKCPFNDILRKKNSRGRDQTSGCQELGQREAYAYKEMAQRCWGGGGFPDCGGSHMHLSTY